MFGEIPMKLLCILSLLALGLTSCATMTVEECKVADWKSVGYKDGTNGETPDYFSKHGKACSKANVTPDIMAWQQGRAMGLKSYCTSSNAYNMGLAGKKLNLVCNVDNINVLQVQNRKGLLIYKIEADRKEIERLREQRDKFYSGDNLGYKNRDKAREYVNTIYNKIRSIQERINDEQNELYQLR